VVATGTVVSHRHAFAPGHTHGLGWASVTAPVATGNSPLAHRHLIFLGIECGGTAGQTDPGDTAAPSADSTAVTPDPDHSPALPSDAVVVPVAVVPPPDRTIIPDRACPLISHARTGVLRS
jgi:hypothetical protein